MSGLTPLEIETNQRYVMATLVTLARLDWRNPAIVLTVTKAAIRRHADLVAPQSSPERQLLVSRAFLDGLMPVLKRLEEPAFDLTAYVAATTADTTLRTSSVVPPVTAKSYARHARGEGALTPGGQGSARRERFLRPVPAAAATIAFAFLFGWQFLAVYGPQTYTDALPPAEVRLAFVRESGARRTLAEVLRDFADIIAANTMRPPFLMPTEDGLFAHAPSVVVVPIAGQRRVQVAFGLRQGAWDTASPTDGACFLIEADGAGPILDRCLDPGLVATDRRIQTGFAAIPPGASRLKLITTCKGHCASDWTYWGRVRLE